MGRKVDEGRGVGFGPGLLGAEEAALLEAAEFGCGAVEGAFGAAAVKIDEVEAAFVFERSEGGETVGGDEFGFEAGSAAEGPGGLEDLVEEDGFEGAGGFEVVVEALGEFIEFGLFVVADDVGAGGEAMAVGVRGGTGFAGGAKE